MKNVIDMSRRASVVFRGMFLGMGSVLVACAGLSAQSSVVWPANYARTPGEEAMNAPFTVSTAHGDRNARSMTLIDGSSLPFGVGSVINQIAFRRDNKHTNTTYGPHGGGTLHVDIGHTDKNAHDVDGTFAENWKWPPTTVFHTDCNLPQAPPPNGVAPFALAIPFQTPWTYWGGNIAIDMVYYNQSPTTWRRDAMCLPVQVNGTYSDIGAGCKGTNSFVPYTYPFVETCVPGRTMVVQLYGMKNPPHPYAPENIAFNILGSTASSYGSLSLPYDLGQMGFPWGCMLRTDIAEIQVTLTQNPGVLFTRAYAFWPLPNLSSLVGARLFTQWICPDFSLTSNMKFTVSNAQAITIGAPDPQPRRFIGRTVWLYGTSGSLTDSGRVSGQEYVPIMQFTGTLQ